MIRSALAGAVLLLLWAVPGHAQAQTQANAWSEPAARMGETVLNDGLSLATQPTAWQQPQWLAFAGAGLGTVVLYQYDATIRSSIQHRRGPLAATVADLANPFGDWRVVFPALAGTAWYAHRQGNPYLQTTSGRAAEAALLAYLSTGVIKSLSGRARPYTELGPHDFDGPGLHGGEHTSFPSGHTAAAFAMASVVARRYPNPEVAWSAYGIAAATGYARMAKDRHWASDVWAGAALGLWIGHSVVNRHQGNGPEISLAPTGGGMTLLLSWNRP